MSRYSLNENGSLDDSISPWGMIRDVGKNAGIKTQPTAWEGISDAFAGKSYKSAPSMDQIDSMMGDEAGDSTGGMYGGLEPMQGPESQPTGQLFSGEIPSMEESFGLTKPKERKGNFAKSFLTGLLATAIPLLAGNRGGGAGFANLMAQSDEEDDDYDRRIKNYEIQRGQLMRSPIFGSAYSRAVQRLKNEPLPEGTDPNAIIQEELRGAYERDANARLYGKSPLGALRGEGYTVDEALNKVSDWKRGMRPQSEKAYITRLQTKFEMEPESLTPEERAQLKAYYKVKRTPSFDWSPDEEFDGKPDEEFDGKPGASMNFDKFTGRRKQDV